MSEEPSLVDLFKPRGESTSAPPPASVKDMFVPRRDVQPESSVSAKVRTVGQGATAGLAQAGPPAAGAYMGAKSGAAIGALGGPYAPITVPLGAGIGAIGGWWAGSEAAPAIQGLLAKVELPWSDETLTFDSIESVPKELRPYAVGGETLGATAVFAGAPYMAVRDGLRFAPNLTGRILNTMIEGATQAPGHFAVAELAMGTSAGIGSGIAESQFPGDPMARMGGEVIGGFANPTRWVMTGYRITANQVKKVASVLSESAQRSRAQDFLIDVVLTHGEDPAALVQALRESDIPGLNLTAGQKTGSPALLALESKLIGQSEQFGEASRKAAQDGLDALKGMIQILETAGDPNSLRAAAQARADYYTILLNGRVRAAEESALQAAADIDTSAPGALAEYGRQTRETLMNAMSDVRDHEKELWGKINKKTKAQSDAVQAAYKAIRAERLPEESLPAIVEGFYQRTRPQDVLDEAGEVIGQEAVEIDTGELIRFRSRALDLAREAAAKSEWSDARVYGQLAEAALDDLAKANVTEPAYQAARDYSRQLNDVFSRTFAGKALEKGQTGAPRIPPELVMERAFGGSGTMTELQLRQLEQAVAFAGKEHLSRMLELQENTLRAAGAQAIDPTTGRVNPARLAKFRQDNAQLLERFPSVAENLKDAQQAELFLRDTMAGRTQAERAIRDRAAFTSLLKGEDPSLALGRVLNGASPRREFKQLVNLAKNDPAAMAGLRSSVFMHAFNKANRMGGFSFKTYREVFSRPLSGKESLRTMMVREGVASERAMTLLDRFLGRAADIEDAVRRRAPIEDIPDKGAAVYDFLLRVAGARFAAVAPTGGAHTLIVGGAGSRMARAVMDKIPRGKTHEFLIEASKNPEILAAMLDSGKSIKAQRRLALQMNAFLWQSGILRGGPAVQEEAEAFFLGP